MTQNNKGLGRNARYRKIGERLFLASKVTDSVIDFITKNYNLPSKIITEKTQMNWESLRTLMKELGIDRKKHQYSKLPFGDSEFDEMFKNPLVSNSEIAYRYRVTPDAIRGNRIRKGIYNVPKAGRTILETRIAIVLNELDLAYREQVKIHGKITDFYLGNKIIVEVDGEWSHKNRKEVDKERDKLLEGFGYRVIRIQEVQIEDAFAIIYSELKDVFTWIQLKEL